jgi:hypothetical protein
VSWKPKQGETFYYFAIKPALYVGGTPLAYDFLETRKAKYEPDITDDYDEIVKSWNCFKSESEAKEKLYKIIKGESNEHTKR